MSGIAKYVNNAMLNRQLWERPIEFEKTYGYNFDCYNFTSIEIINGYNSIDDQLNKLELTHNKRYMIILKTCCAATAENIAIGPTSYNPEMICQAQLNLIRLFSYIDKHKIIALKISNVTFLSPIWNQLKKLIMHAKSLRYLWFDNNVRLCPGYMYEPIIYSILLSKLLVFLWTDSKIDPAERAFVLTDAIVGKYLHNIVLIDQRSYVANVIQSYYNNIVLRNQMQKVIYLLILAHKHRDGAFSCLPKDLLLLILKNVLATYRD